METQYNLRSPSVKRLMKEAAELKDPTELFYAQPLEDNLFEWHFTIRGPPDTDFDGGIYHGRIILPPEYPMKPPSIMLLTANGRFELNKKICLSISGYHPESWQPSWSIRTALLAIIGFMPTDGKGAIGSLDYNTSERKMLAKHSREWRCKICGNEKLSDVLPALTESSKEATMKEAQELAKQLVMKESTEKSTIPRVNSSVSSNSLEAEDSSTPPGLHQVETMPGGLDSMNATNGSGGDASSNAADSPTVEHSSDGLRQRNRVVSSSGEPGGETSSSSPATTQSPPSSTLSSSSGSSPNNNSFASVSSAATSETSTSVAAASASRGRTDTRPTPAPVLQHQAAADERRHRRRHDALSTMTSFAMTLVSVMILALLLRRWYMMNEYRFHHDPSTSSGGDNGNS